MSGRGCWRGKDDPKPYVAGVPAEVPRARTLERLLEGMVCCTRCDLAPGRTQVVTGAGSPSARVLLLGEAPGAQEDLHGRPFVGRSGQLLDRLLLKSGLTRDEIFITNVVSCRPPGNRTPRVSEIRAHTPWLEEQLRLIAPGLVVTLGRVALTWFLPHAKVTEVSGHPQTIEKSGRSFLLLPLFHPAAALRRPELVPALEASFARIPALLAGADVHR